MGVRLTITLLPAGKEEQNCIPPFCPQNAFKFKPVVLAGNIAPVPPRLSSILDSHPNLIFKLLSASHFSTISLYFLMRLAIVTWRSTDLDRLSSYKFIVTNWRNVEDFYPVSNAKRFSKLLALANHFSRVRISGRFPA
jgi:hypothetical protein